MKRFAGTAVVLAASILAASCSRPAGEKKPRIGYVLHGLNDFTAVIQKGAEDAGRDLGVEVEVVGPAGFVTTEAIGMFEALVQKRVDGLVVVPQPGELWVTPIRQATAAGLPVVTANVTSVDSSAAAWFGQDEYRSGVVLATELRRALAAAGKLEGKVVVGMCAPGIAVLVDRYNGFRQGMEGSRYTISEPFDVTTENTRNYGTWENIANAQADMVAAVGLCSLDVPNLAKIKARAGAGWLIAGYDLNLETLEAIKTGAAQVTVGQHPYLQGYLPVRALVEHLRGGKPLVRGWVDVGTEVATRENAVALSGREASEKAEKDWYAKDMAERFQDLGALAKPLPAKP